MEFVKIIGNDAALNVVKISWVALGVQAHGALLEGLWHACMACGDGLVDVISQSVLGDVSQTLTILEIKRKPMSHGFHTKAQKSLCHGLIFTAH